MAINISNLADEIANSLTAEYAGAQDKINLAAEETAKELVANLKAGSPKRTGKYSKGWKVTRQGNTFTAHNRTHPTMTHLLENGHLNRDGSRTPGQPHIAPNEQKAAEDFEEKVRRILEEGGSLMSLEQLHGLLQTLEIPVAYDHFKDEQKPPFLAYRVTSEDFSAADSKTAFRTVNIELCYCSELRNTAFERRIEQLLEFRLITFDTALSEIEKRRPCRSI
jgi:hypothetical protein